MLEKGRINSIQLLLILLMAEIATSLFTVPSRAIAVAGPDAWISMLLIASIYGALIAWLALALSRRFPTRMLTEYLPDIVGCILGKILSGVFALLLINLCGVILSQGTIFVHIAFLRETPPLLLNIIFIAAAFYGAYLGIEVIARHTVLLFAFFSVATLLVILLVIPDLNLENLLPVMENGYLPMIMGGRDEALWRGEVFLLLMLYPYLNLKKEAPQAAYGMIILAAVYTSLITFSVVATFGVEVAGAQIYPVYKLARYISIAQIIERIEIFIVIIWVAAVIIKLSIFLYVAGMAAANTIGAKDYRWPLLGAALGSVAAALLFFRDHAQIDYFFNNIWVPYAISLELLFPGLILLIAVLLKKKEGKEA